MRRLSAPADQALEQARRALNELARPPGVPNRYGEQRFGGDGDNAARGRDILAGDRGPANAKEKRLLLSAAQAELFNQVLDRRLAQGTFGRVIEGDVLAKVPTGAIFTSEDPLEEQARLEAGELVPTGPMFGPKMRAPHPGTEAARLEAEVLAASGIDPQAWQRMGKLAQGTRRPLAVPLGEAEATAVSDAPDAIELRFTLPRGAYATVVLSEVCDTAAAR